MSAGRSGRISLPAMIWLILGEGRTQPVRVATAAIAIAVGVALGFGVHLINASALTEFSRAIAAVNGDADLPVAAVALRHHHRPLRLPQQGRKRRARRPAAPR